MSVMQLSFEDFISSYPLDIKENSILVRELILSMYGNAEEIIDISARIIGYNLGPGYKNTLCTIIPSQKTVKLGFAYGYLINDPECMLTGSGKVHRYVIVKDFYTQQFYLKYLLNEAFKLWKMR